MGQYQSFYHMYILSLKSRVEAEWSRKNIGKILAENFPNLVKNINLQTKEFMMNP